MSTDHRENDGIDFLTREGTDNDAGQREKKDITEEALQSERYATAITILRATGPIV